VHAGLPRAHAVQRGGWGGGTNAAYRGAWPRIRVKVLKEERTCRLCGAPANHVDHTWFIDGLRGERRDGVRRAPAPDAGGGVLAPERVGPHAPHYALADAGKRSSDAVVGMGPIEYLLKDPGVAEVLLNTWARHSLHPRAGDAVGADLRTINLPSGSATRALLADMRCATVNPWKSAT
jgi:hypothetical protein